MNNYMYRINKINSDRKEMKDYQFGRERGICDQKKYKKVINQMKKIKIILNYYFKPNAFASDTNGNLGFFLSQYSH